MKLKMEVNNLTKSLTLPSPKERVLKSSTLERIR
jgi:hypothetical protein